MWLRLYQVEMDGLIPEGPAAAAVVDAAASGPAADLSRGAPHVRAGQRSGPGRAATLHALRHTAAYRMAEDPALPLTDVQSVLGHAQLTTTQIYLTPRKEDVIRRVLAHHAEQTRQARRAGAPGPGARLPARDAGRAVRERRVMTAAQEHDAPRYRRRCSPAQRAGGATAVPAAAGCRDWPATGQDRGRGVERLTSAPFVPAQRRQPEAAPRGLAWLLDWLADQPGETWQQRWLASGADAAGGGWRQSPGRLAARARPVSMRGCARAVRGVARG